MNENQTTTVEKGLDDKRKNAMLRYIGIMFIVAFVFVLVSMLGELRSSEATISALNQSSTSAITKAEQLQDHNRQLETDNAYLEGRIEEMEKSLEQTEAELREARNELSEQTKDITALKTQLDETLEDLAELQAAYEQLKSEIPVGTPAE